MRTPKKLLSVLVAVIMILSLIPVTALADEPDETGAPQTEVTDSGQPGREDGETPPEGPETPETPEETETPEEAEVPEETETPEVPETPEPVFDFDAATDEEIGDTGAELSEVEKLQAAINAAEDEVETTITMTADIIGMTTDKIINVPAGKVIVLDMAGHSITVSNDFSGRAIENAGILTVQGNGTIDASNGSTGYGAINNSGTLTIENGTFRGNSETNASNIRNVGKDAVLVINDGTFDTSSTAVLNYDGLATLNGGTYTTHDHNCSACGSNWAYVIRTYTDGKEGVYPRLYVNGGSYTGTQGALNSGAGYIEVNDGTFKTVACAKNHKAIFYAINVAGYSGSISGVINGGTFETEGPYTAALLGNDNTNGDGGINADTVVHIYGGKFTAPEGVPAVKVSANTAKASILHGGTYSTIDENAAKYIDPAVIGESGTNITLIPRTENDKDTVATVGGKYYPTLQAAITAAKGGETVTLLKDTELSEVITIEKGIILNTNQHKITFVSDGSTETGYFLRFESGKSTITGGGEIVDGRVSADTGGYYMITVKGDNASLTVEDATLTTYRSKGESSYVFFVQNGASLTLNKGAVVHDERHPDLTSDDEITKGCYGVYILNGTTFGNSELTVNEDAVISTSTYAITGNGSDGSFFGTQITINGGTIASSMDTAIYHPQKGGELTINGGEITGKASGVEIRAGTLTMTGGTVTGLADTTTAVANGNGHTTSGAGIAVAQHTTKQKITVNIENGTVKGCTALYESNPQNNGETDLEKISIKITGGDFVATNGGTQAVYSEAAKDGIITPPVQGGNFSHSVKEYVVDELNAELQKSSGAAPFSYTTVEKALKNPDPSVAITVLSSGDGTAMDTVTLQYGNGTADITIKVEKDAELSLPTDLKRDGYTFGGWYNGDNEVGSYTGVGGENITLTAKWTANAITVTFNANGGEVETTSKNVAVGGTYGDLPTPTRIGYTFAGWYTAAENGTEVKADTVVSSASDHILYAHWTVNQYTITFNTDGGSTIEAITQDYGTTVTAPAAPTKAGYTFTGWDKEIPSTMPAEDMTITAQWNRNSPSGGSSSGSTTYTVSVDSTRHGDVTVSPKSASKGTTVTITVKPDEGYELDDLTVTDKDGDTVKLTKKSDTKYTFTMPASKVTVEAIFAKIEEAPAHTFTDVPDGYWAEDEIAWAYENGYMNGNTAVTFNPNGTVTRQQLWMILARLSGQRPADFAEARAWAMDNGISDGTNPGGAVTRQQMVAILYRYAQLMGYGTSGSTALSAFPDNGSVAAYAKDAMSWSVANGIVGGTAQGTLNPAGTATRAQFAVILYRFCDKAAK